MLYMREPSNSLETSNNFSLSQLPLDQSLQKTAIEQNPKRKYNFENTKAINCENPKTLNQNL